MAGKKCAICGKPSGMYPLCSECFADKDKGNLLKCEECGQWHKTDVPCSCREVVSGYFIGDRIKNYNRFGTIEKVVDKRVIVKYDDDQGEGTSYALVTLYNYENLSGEKRKIENIINEKIQKGELSRKVLIGKDVIDSETKDVRKKWEANNQCDDGHYVRSYSEMLIDNWLYNNGYLHAYEKKVFMPTEPDEIVLSDFYLPKGNVYIEFWGKDTDKYNMRRERKLQLYKDNNYNVINIEPDDIKIIGDILQRKIFDYIKNK